MNISLPPRTFLFPFLVLIACATNAKDPYPVNRNLDILHYRFNLVLSDSTDAIHGESEITFRLTGNALHFDLDLVGQKTDGTGMTVITVGPENRIAGFSHKADKLTIRLRATSTEPQTLFIRYKGTPADGLIIGKNKYNNRGFFGDNWPDRAHHWLPCVDHPSDKATVEFIVDAPEVYAVVATGKLIEVSARGNGRKVSHWQETAPVPMKVMTIGAARFAIRNHGQVEGTEISTWVYPQDRDAGFRDFSCADSIFRFFNQYIGPFSFEKLAHVQSRTRWGGLENAGAIFYTEKAVTGNRKIESLVAHESAHQWFGDAATEMDWHHVWLSEGFATYFAHLYQEFAHGETARQRNMDRDRGNIFKNDLLGRSPVVDTTILDINNVLSIITYQKASWVLHMLRREVGDQAFQTGIRNYYAAFRNRNAWTLDFQKEMEHASGKDLSGFFRQWIFTAGAPQLDIRWSYSSKTKEVRFRVKQTGNTVFSFPLEIQFLNGGKSLVNTTLSINQKEAEFRVKCDEKPDKMVPDPNVNLLFQAKIEEGRL